VEISEVTTSYSVLRYLEEIALFDNLTGVRNRNAYIDTAKQIVTEENMPLLILVGDVNNLKKVNDSRGHLYGDRLLIAITKIIREKAPKGADVFRIGGDEFVLLVPKANDEAAQEFASAVEEACAHPDDPDIDAPSISWGHAVMRAVDGDYNEAFKEADAILYESKRRMQIESIAGIVPAERQ
jgi:diguanylate cyclase (GGDEF)-like protein